VGAPKLMRFAERMTTLLIAAPQRQSREGNQ
jgi:hypothetical protein